MIISNTKAQHEIVGAPKIQYCKSIQFLLHSSSRFRKENSWLACALYMVMSSSFHDILDYSKLRRNKKIGKSKFFLEHYFRSHFQIE